MEEEFQGEEKKMQKIIVRVYFYQKWTHRKYIFLKNNRSI